MKFVIYEDITKDAVIPNGFNMSMDEYYRHQFQRSNTFNLQFCKIDHGLGKEEFVPLHKLSYLANTDFFNQAGQIYYIINLLQHARKYPSLFEVGMNFWLNHIDNKILENINHGKIKLIITAAIEPISIEDICLIVKNLLAASFDIENFEIWSPFAPPFDNQQIREEFINYWTAKAKDKENIDFYIQRSNKIYDDGKQVVKDIPYWEYQTIKNYPNEQLELNKIKKYICLNRRHTDERILTHCYIVANNLLEQGYNTIPGKSTTSYRSLSQMIDKEFLINYKEFDSEIEQTKNYWKTNKQGVSLDEEPLMDNQRTIYSNDYLGFSTPPQLEKYYRQSYISLICEGDMSFCNFLISEKTYRAIQFMHPFIIIGPYGILEALKHKGYKTFSNIWSEQYDKIVDNQLRWKTALDVFKDVITNTNMDDLYKECNETLIYNYNHMLYRVKNYKDNL